MSQRRRTFAWNGWANRATLQSLKDLVSPPPQAVLWLAHIVAAERLWLGRIEGSSAGEVWPNLTLDECASGIAEMEVRWQALLDRCDDDGLDRTVEYVNTRGSAFSNRVEEILTHVLFHSAHHRAQIASCLREAGGEPAITDFIHAARSHLIPD